MSKHHEWIDGFKICPQCGVNKPKSEYPKDASFKSGVSCYCKTCKNKQRSVIAKSPYGKATNRKKQATYEKTEKGKENKRKFRTSPKGRIMRKKAKSKRKRGMGFIQLNKPFIGSVAHHINDQEVVHIPELIHVMGRDKTREKHRKMILDYYGSIDNMIINRVSNK